MVSCLVGLLIWLCSVYSLPTTLIFLVFVGYNSSSLQSWILTAILSFLPGRRFIGRWLLDYCATHQGPNYRLPLSIALIRSRAPVSTEDLPALQLLMQDDSPFVRANITLVLSKLGRDALPAVQDILRVFQHEENEPWMTINASLALEGLEELLLPYADQIAPLLQDPDAVKRIKAAWLFFRLGSTAEAKMSIFVQMANSDPNPRVRGLATQLLELLEYPKISTLAESMIEETEEYLLYSAIRVFRRSRPLPDAIEMKLRTLLFDKRPWISCQAAMTLSEACSNRKDTAKFLATFLGHNTADSVHTAGVLSGFAELEEYSKPYLDLILKYCSHPHKSVRINATAVLIDNPETHHIPTLIKGLKDSAWEVRSNVATALGILEEKASSVVPHLEAALKDEEPMVRLNVKIALARISGNNRDAIALLVSGFDECDHDNYIRFFGTVYSFKYEETAFLRPKFEDLLDSEDLVFRSDLKRSLADWN